ncbi:MAG: DNA mismatch repair protein MutS [Bacteroidetes bacterium]|nr:DNA mismatch repair protein MutS [Fibrella sp.]
MTRQDFFLQRQQTFTQTEQAAQRRYNQLAIGRLIWFMGALAAVWVAINAEQTVLAVIAGLVGLIGFLYLLKRHQDVRQERDYAHHLVFINQDEAARLERKFLRPETGSEFTDSAHPYAGDLDVFGTHSLFRLLNRTHTYQGTHQLANWLRHPADAATIRLRQQAVTELNPLTDWRQRFEAIAYLNPSVSESPAALLAWAEEDAIPIPGYLHWIRWALPAITITLFGCWLAGLVPGLTVIGALAVHGLVLKGIGPRMNALTEKTYVMARALGTYHELFAHIEAQPFQAGQLQQNQKRLTSGAQSASSTVATLSRLTENLSFRQNPYFVLFFGLATLWDIHYLIGLEKWRQRHGGQLALWFNALGDLECLNSLAGLAFAHLDYTIPAIHVTGVHLEAKQAAHPMLIPGKAVANSLTLAGAGQTVLITGSNMSGKSTFLRTLGANTVLALAGSVVSAEHFSCSAMQLFTSMRTQDSLEESTSSFYAELKRLQTLIRLTKATSQRPILYFLDEILKGTNSADRHRGADALIRQLHRTTASGFVSTHDLELGQLGNDEDFVRNYHFQSDIRDGELLFDYRLRDGICESFNASQLMQAIGIEITTA